MPLRLIYNVKVSTGQKVGLIAVFGLGFVMIAFSVIRANQILVPKMFVNLSLLMLWSTLAATICKSFVLCSRVSPDKNASLTGLLPLSSQPSS